MCFTVNFAKLLRTPVFTEHLWAPASVIRTVQCGTLTIKKTSAKTLQIGLYSVFLNLPIKHVQENKKVKKKKMVVKEKEHFLIHTSLQLQY